MAKNVVFAFLLIPIIFAAWLTNALEFDDDIMKDTISAKDILNETVSNTSSAQGSHNKTVDIATPAQDSRNETLNSTASPQDSRNETVNTTASAQDSRDGTVNTTTSAQDSPNERVSNTTSAVDSRNETVNVTSSTQDSRDETSSNSSAQDSWDEARYNTTSVQEFDSTKEVTTNKSSCTTRSANDYADELISKLRNETVDSISLPRRNGFISLKDGQVWGLSTLKRAGDAQLYCNENSVSLEVLLSFDGLKGRYTWERPLALAKLSGFVLIKADKADVLFVLIQDRGKDSVPVLGAFSIMDFSGIRTKVTGLDLVPLEVPRITDPIVNLFEGAVSKVIDGPLRDALSFELKNFNLLIH